MTGVIHMSTTYVDIKQRLRLASTETYGKPLNLGGTPTDAAQLARDALQHVELLERAMSVWMRIVDLQTDLVSQAEKAMDQYERDLAPVLQQAREIARQLKEE